MGPMCTDNLPSHTPEHDGMRSVVLPSSCPRTFAVATGPVAIFLVGLVLLDTLAPSTCRAEWPVADAPGVTVISPSEVLSEFTHNALDGALLFEEPGGALVRLITSTDDPQIANPGDGSFHSADVAAVIAAVESLPASFTAPLLAQVFILPYPRAGMLSSSASDHAIYISPSVYPVDDGPALRALIVHELGHVIDRQLLSDHPEMWETYVDLRGIGDASIYHPAAMHAYRPAEIFAEDFRVLFGGDLASAPSIENPDLVSPELVPGLYDWFLSLVPQFVATSSVAERVEMAGFRVFPNPLRGGSTVTLEWVGPTEVSDEVSDEESGVDGDFPAALYDAAGRVVHELTFASRDRGRWTATVPSLAAGSYWMRPQRRAGGVTILRVVR